MLILEMISYSAALDKISMAAVLFDSWRNILANMRNDDSFRDKPMASLNISLAFNEK